MSAVLHVPVLMLFGMRTQLLLLYMDALFFTALLFLEVDFNSFYSFRCTCTTSIGGSWQFTNFDQDDVEQALTCLCITVLLKDDSLLKYCQFGCKSNAHVG